MASQRARDEQHRSLETLAVLAVACLVCGLVFKAPPFGYAALGLLLIGLFFKRLALKLSEAWLRFARILGAVNSKVLLTLLYYLILVPVAVLSRWNTGDALKLKRGDDNHRSYWIVREHQFEPRDLERPW
jgi:hypothetical protein